MVQSEGSCAKHGEGKKNPGYITSLLIEYHNYLYMLDTEQ